MKRVRDMTRTYSYEFSDYKTFKKLFRDLYYRKLTINEAKSKQGEFNGILGALSNYSPRDQKYIEAKNKLLNNAENFYNGRKKIIKGFKDGIFSLNHDDVVEEQVKYEGKEKNITNKNDPIDYKKFERLIDLSKRDINDELVRKHFLVQDLGALLEKMKKSKNEPKKE